MLQNSLSFLENTRYPGAIRSFSTPESITGLDRQAPLDDVQDSNREYAGKDRYRMNHERKAGGKRKLVADVMALGFPARKAAKAVNTVVRLMREALAYHEPVELPGIGQLKVVVQKGKPAQRLQKTRNVSSGQVEMRVMTFRGRRRVIKLRPDPNLRLPLSPVPATSSKPRPQPQTAPPISRLPNVAHTFRSGVEPRYRPGYRRGTGY
jgi:nucleoid DNA-binding protein